MVSATLRDLVNQMGPQSDIVVLEISVDSVRDVPSRLKAYQALFGKKLWTMASTTNEAELTAFWKFFGAAYQREEVSLEEAAGMPRDWQTGEMATTDVTRPDVVYIIGPGLVWEWLDEGNPSPDDKSLPVDLKAYLTDEGLQNLAAPEDPTWTAGAILSALRDLGALR